MKFSLFEPATMPPKRATTLDISETFKPKREKFSDEENSDLLELEEPELNHQEIDIDKLGENFTPIASDGNCVIKKLNEEVDLKPLCDLIESTPQGVIFEYIIRVFCNKYLNGNESENFKQYVHFLLNMIKDPITNNALTQLLSERNNFIDLSIDDLLVLNKKKNEDIPTCFNPEQYEILNSKLPAGALNNIGNLHKINIQCVDNIQFQKCTKTKAGYKLSLKNPIYFQTSIMKMTGERAFSSPQIQDDGVVNKILYECFGKKYHFSDIRVCNNKKWPNIKIVGNSVTKSSKVDLDECKALWFVSNTLCILEDAKSGIVPKLYPIASGEHETFFYG